MTNRDKERLATLRLQAQLNMILSEKKVPRIESFRAQSSS